MNPDVIAKAESLAEALAQSQEYKAYKEAKEELERHEAAKIMLRDFQRKQSALQRKVMAGEMPAEAEVQSLQDAYRLVVFNPYVRKVIEAEAVLSQLLAEIQAILARAVGIELPGEGDEGPDGPGQGTGGSGRSQSDDGGSARSRLWVPGR